MAKKIDKKMPVSELAAKINLITSTERPQGQGNTSAIWPIMINGDVIKSNPIGCTLDAMSLCAAVHLDGLGIDRAQAMRFGLVLYSFLLGNWRVFPDVAFKLSQLVSKAGGVQGQALRAFHARVMAMEMRENDGH